MESKLDALKLPLRKNYQEIDLESNKQRIGKIEFNNSIIENASFLIFNMLLDYVKAGRKVEQLTTKENYIKNKDCKCLSLKNSRSQKRIKKDYDLCWTSQKECDICVVEQSKNKGSTQ